MWQRQIQLRLFSGAPRWRPIGCGSWTTIVSHSPCRSSALSALISSNSAHCSSVSGLLGALQRVVEQLGRVEELFLAEDDVPVGVEPDVAHQRHDRVEDLRDAAAERGRADVQNPLPLQRLGELADPLGQLLAGDVGVVGEGLLAEGDFLKHRRISTGWRGWPAARPSSTARSRLGSLAERDLDGVLAVVGMEDFERHLRGRAGSLRCSGRGRRGGRPYGRRRRESCRRRPGRGTPWKSSFSSPPSRPASSAGPPGTTSATRPPNSASRPSFSASCG